MRPRQPAAGCDALAGAATELHINANWTAIAKSDGEFAPSAQTYAGTGTLRYMW